MSTNYAIAITMRHCNHTLSGSSVDFTSQVRSSTMMVVIKYNLSVDYNGVKSIPNFIHIRREILQLNHADREKDGRQKRRRDRQTWSARCSFIVGLSCKEHTKNYMVKCLHLCKDQNATLLCGRGAETILDL